MRITWKQFYNTLFIVAIAVILFTPLGFQIKVYINRLFSFSPSEIPTEQQNKLRDYNWHLVTSDGIPLEFSEVKGKVVLINFWATWCPPCVAEMPSLQKLYTDYGDRIKFVFIAHDERKNVFNFMNKNQLNLPVYFESSSTPKQLETSSIPSTFLLDSDGKIRISKVGSADWDSPKIRNLLDSLLSERNLK